MLSVKYLTTTLLSATSLVLSAVVFPSVVTGQPLFLAQTQPLTPEAAAIDQLFSADSPPPGADAQSQQLFRGIKSWMGDYQQVQTDGDGYLVIFEKGSLPFSARLDANGQIESVSAGCPRSTSLNLNQASTEIRQVFSECPSLQN